MNPEEEQRAADTDAGQPAPLSPAPRAAVEEALALLRRIERDLEEIRGHVESAARTQRHREFSFPRLLGALCQAVVVGLVIVAVAGWAYRLEAGDQLIALALAGVLQLAALTAFVVSRGPR